MHSALFKWTIYSRILQICSVLPSYLLPNLIGDSFVMLPFLATAGAGSGTMAASDMDLDAFDLELELLR